MNGRSSDRATSSGGNNHTTTHRSSLFDVAIVETVEGSETTTETATGRIESDNSNTSNVKEEDLDNILYGAKGASEQEIVLEDSSTLFDFVAGTKTSNDEDTIADEKTAIEFVKRLNHANVKPPRVSSVTTTDIGGGLVPTASYSHRIHTRPSMFNVQDIRRAGSRVSQSVGQAILDVGQKMSHPANTAEEYLDPDRTDHGQFSTRALTTFLSLQGLSYALFVTGRYPTFALTIPITVLSIFTMIGILRWTDSSKRGGRFVGIVLILMVLSGSFSSMWVATSSCGHCVYHWAQDAMTASHSFDSHKSRDRKRDLNVLWDLLFSSEADEPDSLVGSCRLCVRDFATFLSLLPLFSIADDDDAMEEEIVALEEENKFNISVYESSSSLFGDLANWYIQYIDKTSPKVMKRFNKKIVAALTDEGRLNDESLNEAMTDFLCSPASRFDSPDPGRFLADIRRPRLTGETSLNISAKALQSIMRGDPLKEMGVPVCFMLRIALFVPNDPEIDNKAIRYTHLMPSMNEEGMKSRDYSSCLPFLVIPGRDQDIDWESKDMDRFGRIMDIFTRFPYESQMHYFETKQEYYAFYRWEFEGALQDEFYFPQWFYHTEKSEEMANFRAKRTKVSSDHLALEDPYSDKTLGDRSFYGAGQQFLTPMKIPGIDEDYEYLFPSGPHSYLSEEHRDTEAFRYPHKPRASDLLKMIHAFWPKDAKQKRAKATVAPLAAYKDRVVEIDFAVFGALPGREPFISPGPILYLDPKTKMPIGIWKSPTREMILPNEGSKWDHAKFYYRVTERAAVAAKHVIESHLGWSLPVATASWQTFPQDHPFRSFLKPFTLNAHSVNSAAYHMLLRENAVLTHGSTFTTEGVVGTMTTFWPHINFSQTVPESLDSRGMDKVLKTDSLPLYSQAKRLFAVHHRFVKNFVDHWYPRDEDLLKDDSVIRFWHHTNTYGRHIDPCVCGLPSDLFFDDHGVWPMFETTRTCNDLLDVVQFEPNMHEVSRRRNWCSSTDPWSKVKAVRKMNDEICASNQDCKSIVWDRNSLRPDMGMGTLQSKEQFINFIASFIWHVTAGHSLNSDNFSEFSDPEYSGVRILAEGPDGKPARIADVGTYVFGSSVGLLTSVRTAPLLADWMPLYSHLIAKQNHLSTEEKEAKLRFMEDIHREYKFGLFDLAVTFLDESTRLPHNRRSNALNPATHASSVSV